MGGESGRVRIRVCHVGACFVTECRILFWKMIQWFVQLPNVQISNLCGTFAFWAVIVMHSRLLQNGSDNIGRQIAEWGRWKWNVRKEPIIAQHPFSRHVVWGKSPSKRKHKFVNMEAGFTTGSTLDSRRSRKLYGFLYMYFCIGATIACLVAHSWRPDRQSWMDFASSRISCHIPKVACQQRESP